MCVFVSFDNCLTLFWIQLNDIVSLYSMRSWKNLKLKMSNIHGKGRYGNEFNLSCSIWEYHNSRPHVSSHTKNSFSLCGCQTKHLIIHLPLLFLPRWYDLSLWVSPASCISFLSFPFCLSNPLRDRGRLRWSVLISKGFFLIARMYCSLYTSVSLYHSTSLSVRVTMA